MAEQEETARQQNDEQAAKGPAGAAGLAMPWLVTALAVMLCGGAGFFAGRMFGTRGKAQTVSAGQRADSADAVPATQSVTEPDDGATWYYELEPIVANLNEPGVTRYVRAALTLEIGNGLDKTDGTALLDRKKPLIKHWLTLFLSNQTMDDIRGERNLRHAQARIADTLNQGLFPDAKPCIVRILFKEISVQ